MRRAHAIARLDDGMAVSDVARTMYVDDDAVYRWQRSNRHGALNLEGGDCRLATIPLLTKVIAAAQKR